MIGRCQAQTVSGLPCRRPLGTPSAGARLCGLHELARRRAARGRRLSRVAWRGYALTPADHLLAVLVEPLIRDDAARGEIRRIVRAGVHAGLAELRA